MYPFRSIEQKWQKIWVEHHAHQKPKNPKKPFYVLEMLPYPSGRIHMGHVRNYTLGDALARFKRSAGFDVLHPMGWDAFGLPAENAALERGVHPGKWTHQNIADMQKQLEPLGFSYDWSQAIATCDPDYYRHEQGMFITFFEKGLTERRKSVVNWDPVDQCVLANEQVVDGKGWRSGAPIERRELDQWFLHITRYAPELHDHIEKGYLKDWPEKVTKMQTNWLGQRDGWMTYCKTSNHQDISFFITDQEHLQKAYALILPTSHDLAKSSNLDTVRQLIHASTAVPAKEAAMATQAKKWADLGITIGGMPVWVGNWVDEPLLITEPMFGLEKTYAAEPQKTEAQTTWRLRDWLVSRQRYWGCPIPMVHCEDCGIVPVKREDLPVKLPDDAVFDGKGNPLANHPTWKHTTCPTCSKPAIRETDTLDTFFESSWYFLRYINPFMEDKAFDAKDLQTWMPVDVYIGGVEHAVMHLLYARFFYKALIDCGYIEESSEEEREPFKKLLTQGMVCHETYKRSDGAWLYPGEVEKRGNSYTCKETGQSVTVGRSEKMSKSKRNTVEPESMLSAYGADAVRLFVLSDTPPEKDLDWSEEALEGSWRYMNRLWRLNEQVNQYEEKSDPDNHDLLKIAHRLLEKITEAYDQMAFNKVIAWHRELTNALEEQMNNGKANYVKEVWRIALQIIAPITPHIAQELWSENAQSKEELISSVTWPQFDPALAAEDVITLAVQVNGKLRGTIEVEPNATDTHVQDLALELPTVQAALGGNTPKKVIIVPKRIVNIVV